MLLSGRGVIQECLLQIWKDRRRVEAASDYMIGSSWQSVSDWHC